MDDTTRLVGSGQGVPTYSGTPAVGYAGYPQQGYQQPQAQGYENPGYPQSNPGYPQSNPGYPQSNPGFNPGYPQPNAGPNPGYPQPNPGQYPQSGAPPQPQAGHIYKGEVPTDDVRDDPNMAAPAPSAPPPDLMDRLPGYESIGFNSSTLPPPPSYAESQSQPPQKREQIESAPTITEEAAREALMEFVSEHCCYGSGPAKGMSLRQLRGSSAFHYTLETFAEGRSTKWTYRPHTGEPVIVNGAPPSAWEIQAAAPKNMFNNAKLEIEVPNTASVKPCHACGAMGFVRCYRCRGRGRLFCTSCDGTGKGPFHEDGGHHHGDHHGGHHGGHHHGNHHHGNHHHGNHHHGNHHHHHGGRRPCTWCNGTGRKNCYTCGTSGQIMCGECKGRANLRWFIQLTITWTNHKQDHVVEKTALPDELIKTVSGQMAFTETQPRVWPINHFPDQEINSASNALVSSHGTKFPSEKILMQRHQVRIVPVTEVDYVYKERQSSFFVYGFEHKVFAPDYPAKCCCGCSVL